MPEKILNTHVLSKHDTEGNWEASEYIPKTGELIIYDTDSTYSYPRIKVGDGVSNAANLPFERYPTNIWITNSNSLAELQIGQESDSLNITSSGNDTSTTPSRGDYVIDAAGNMGRITEQGDVATSVRAVLIYKTKQGIFLLSKGSEGRILNLTVGSSLFIDISDTASGVNTIASTPNCRNIKRGSLLFDFNGGPLIIAAAQEDYDSMTGGITTTTIYAAGASIPKSQLTTDVQASLDRADSALQSAPVTSVNNKTGAVNLTAADVGAATAESVSAILNNTSLIKNQGGGFQGGAGASAGKGAAIGDGASAELGGAVGCNASANIGGAVGYLATVTANGFAGGQEASATHGGAIGMSASATSGGAVGDRASATSGFAGGLLAHATAEGAVQLGQGTNNNAKTLQFRDYQIVDANGNIPASRLSANSPVRSVNGKTGAVNLTTADAEVLSGLAFDEGVGIASGNIVGYRIGDLAVITVRFVPGPKGIAWRNWALATGLPLPRVEGNLNPNPEYVGVCIPETPCALSADGITDVQFNLRVYERSSRLWIHRCTNTNGSSVGAGIEFRGTIVYVCE